MIYFFKKQQGFSLVETLVAVSILLIVITGPMSISMRTAKSSSFASEQVQAFFLAQEGLELAAKARDELFLKSFLEPAQAGYLATPWNEFTQVRYSLCFAAPGCGLEWGANSGVLAAVRNCASGCLLHFDSTGNRSKFTYTVTTQPTLFTRTIYFTPTPQPGGVKVRSVVEWRTGSLVASQKIEVESYLYNVYDKP